MPLRHDDSVTTVFGPTGPPGEDVSSDAPSFGGFAGSGQQASAHLGISVAGYHQPADPQGNSSDDVEYYVVVDLGNGGSTVSPGTLAETNEDNKGFYTHAVEVQMSFDSVYALDTDVPPSTQASGSTSYSDSLSVGFFGDQLTATESTSQTGSRAYGDYEITNSSTPDVIGKGAVHHYALRLSDGGGGYRSPFSLIDSPTSGVSLHHLLGLVPRSTSRFALTSAAAFRATLPAKTPPDPAVLTITVKHWLAKVVWYSGWQTLIHGSPQLGDHVTMVGGGVEMTAIDDYDVTTSAGVYLLTTGAYLSLPWSYEATWQFVADFKNASFQQYAPGLAKAMLQITALENAMKNMPHG
jgi:hypothetical protein